MWTRCPGTHRVCWLYHFLAVSFWGKLTSTCFHFLISKLGIVKGLISQDCCANLITSIQQQPPPAASIITSVPYSSAIFPHQTILTHDDRYSWVSCIFILLLSSRTWSNYVTITYAFSHEVGFICSYKHHSRDPVYVCPHMWNLFSLIGSEVECGGPRE